MPVRAPAQAAKDNASNDIKQMTAGQGHIYNVRGFAADMATFYCDERLAGAPASIAGNLKAGTLGPNTICFNPSIAL
jgi:hypothetical protein